MHVCLLACVRACLSIHLLGGHGSVSSMQAFWLVVHGSGGGGGLRGVNVRGGGEGGGVKVRG